MQIRPSSKVWQEQRVDQHQAQPLTAGLMTSLSLHVRLIPDGSHIPTPENQTNYCSIMSAW